jgi:AcrR family transcriptional regulator
LVNRVSKVSPARWLETARQVLIQEGVDRVKVDRLAKRLRVTRGGFYHHFRDRADLLDQLLTMWEEKNTFLPTRTPPQTQDEAHRVLDQINAILIDEAIYDPHFDMAIRDWARTSKKVKTALDRVDAERLTFFEQMFLAFGYDQREALIRARVSYFHQVGYYALAIRETRAQRYDYSGLYLKILAGEKYTGPN